MSIVNYLSLFIGVICSSVAMAETRAPISTELLEKAISLNLMDGFKNFPVSGLSIENGSVVSWKKCDVCVANGDENPKSRSKFFIPYYRNDKNQKDFTDADFPSGGVRLSHVDEETGAISCHLDQPFSVHWQEPVLGGIYCVKNREGLKYGLIRVREIKSNGIHIDVLASYDMRTQTVVPFIQDIPTLFLPKPIVREQNPPVLK